ncbi:threonine dehydrogenase [Loktanella sp. IMCC34160]|uniref:alcohol dehydrogenase catalytic domain-containing protein n=1 Tax=Loktanella sp. IMCC34160 TaxID=2510646 RepID=UPI00101D46EE|nr:alcohol dehydrogenase catalytic domain-containing protein [Loktanella sp. IMCC34160]RYG93079.1 threonine dehydrogenase [Loktanella sp. IMCC34160]
MSLRSADRPALEDGDVLVRVRSATICGTDIRIYRGKKTAGVRYPSVLGHEFAGEIVDTGGHAGLTMGDRVGLCPFIGCGQCHLCKTGRENLCLDGTAIGYQIDGAFAEYIRIPAAAIAAGNLRKLPDHMSCAEAALVEPLACVLNGQNKVGLSSADTVVILGAGPIGLLHVHLARLRGARRILSSDPNAHRRDAALAAGADATIDPTAEDVKSRVLAETGGAGADVVICAIGIPALARQATDLAAMGGRISLFAGFSKGETAEMDVNAIHYNELIVTGAFGLSRKDYDRAFDMIATGRLNLGSMITHRYPLDDIGTAFETAESGAAIKVAISDE